MNKSKITKAIEADLVDEGQFQFMNARQTVVRGSTQSSNIDEIYNLTKGKDNIKATSIDGELVFFDDSEHGDAICEEIYRVRFSKLTDVLALGEHCFISRESIKSVQLFANNDIEYVVVKGRNDKTLAFFGTDKYDDIAEVQEVISLFHSGDIEAVDWEKLRLPSLIENADVVDADA